MEISRRDVLKGAAAGAVVAAVGQAVAQPVTGAAIEPNDRVFICNEDSNTLAVIDPRSNMVETTVNLTSFDEDPRPPFRFVTGGVMPTLVVAAIAIAGLYFARPVLQPLAVAVLLALLLAPAVR